MKALVYNGPNDITLTDVPMPTIKEPTDAILKVTSSAICGSDIHILQGHVASIQPGTTIGHEFCGEVVELGSQVAGFKVGDKVAVSCIVHCGHCFYCLNGNPENCSYAKGLGYDNSMLFGNYIDGAQAEYVRVPLAATGMYLIPEGLTDEDVLFVGDILSTGYYGVQKAGVGNGDYVVVIGAGPVGLCTMASARLFGPAKIIAVDLEQNRLDAALANGVADVAINSGKTDPLQKIMELTNGRGADAVIEAIGLPVTFKMALDAVRVGGKVATIGVFAQPVELPMHLMLTKNLSVSWGLVPADNIPTLIRLIENGKLDLRFLITHSAPLNDIIKGYDIFGNKKEGCIKWVVKPYVF